MTIDPSSPTPMYWQLKRWLLEAIAAGRYGRDGRLPTEHELCQELGISRTPVIRALSELADEGVVVRHRRRGTFVEPGWFDRNAARPEVAVLVPDGPWEEIVQRACPTTLSLKVTSVPLQHLHRELVRAIGEGAAPDLALLDSVWIAEFATAGFLWPLAELDREWVTKVHDAEFLEPFVSAYRVEGRTYAVQAEADVAGLWYRRAAVAEVDGEPPRTWSDLERLGHRLVEHGGPPFPLALPGGPAGGETTTYCLLALLAANDATVLDERGVVLDSLATRQSLEFLRRATLTGLVDPAVVTLPWDGPATRLATGQAAMALGGSYDARNLAQATGRSIAAIDDDFGFVPVPGGPSGGRATLGGGMVYGVLRQATRPELAIQLLDRLVAPEALAAMARMTGQIPPRRPAVELVESELPFLAATATFLRHAVVRPATPAYPRVSAQLQTMLESVLVGEVDPAEAARRAADRISAITGARVVRS